MKSDTTMKTTQFVASAQLPTEFGTFKIYGFHDTQTGKEHVAIVKGDVCNKENVVARIHSECLTGDALGSLKCDCRPQLIAGLQEIGNQECGILLYLRQEGRGIGLLNKIKAYNLQDQGCDTYDANVRLGFPPDARTYNCAADMLKYLEVRSVILMTNNPDKISSLQACGITVVDRKEHSMVPNPHNTNYMKTKNQRFGHLISSVV